MNLKLRILKETAVLGVKHKPGDEMEVADRDLAATAVKMGVAEIVKPSDASVPSVPGPATH